MTAVICAALICASLLLAQHQTHRHEVRMSGGAQALAALQARLEALEGAKSSGFDRDAFEDLKTKVEAMRMAQGLRGSR